MNKKYSKNQIIKAIKHWTSILESMDGEKSICEKKMLRSELDDFYSRLQAGEVNFKFIKKDGSLRNARGTLNPELMPTSEEIQQIYAEQGIQVPELMSRLEARKDFMPYFWDLENNGFRQFHVSRFIGYI